MDCEQAGLFGLREEAEQREGREKGRTSGCGDDRGVSLNLSSITAILEVTALRARLRQSRQRLRIKEEPTNTNLPAQHRRIWMPTQLTRRQEFRRGLFSETNAFGTDCDEQQDRLCAGDRDSAPRAADLFIATALLSRC